MWKVCILCSADKQRKLEKGSYSDLRIFTFLPESKKERKGTELDTCDVLSWNEAKVNKYRSETAGESVKKKSALHASEWRGGLVQNWSIENFVMGTLFEPVLNGRNVSKPDQDLSTPIPCTKPAFSNDSFALRKQSSLLGTFLSF